MTDNRKCSKDFLDWLEKHKMLAGQKLKTNESRFKALFWVSRSY